MKIKENNRMEKVEIKVRETIKAKDQTIQSLKDELAASNTKVSSGPTGKQLDTLIINNFQIVLKINFKD